MDINDLCSIEDTTIFRGRKADISIPLLENSIVPISGKNIENNDRNGKVLHKTRDEEVRFEQKAELPNTISSKSCNCIRIIARGHISFFTKLREVFGRLIIRKSQVFRGWGKFFYKTVSATIKILKY